MRSTNQLLVCAALCTSVAFAACGGDEQAPTASDISESNLKPAGSNDTTSTNTGSGAIANIRVSPHQVTIGLGASLTVSALPIDASGIPILTLLATPPTWTVENSAIASVSSTGTIVGISAGTTKVYATLGTFKDFTTVTVLTTRDTIATTPPAPTPPTAPAPVTSFTLTAYVYAPGVPVAAHDTSTVVRFAGANVSVYRLSANALVASDTLGVRTLVQSAVTGADGQVVFGNLPAGYYVITAQGTVSGSQETAESYIGTPTSSTVQIGMFLHK